MTRMFPPFWKVLSLRRWNVFLSRGNRWFVVFGHLYRLNESATRTFRRANQNYSLPGRKGEMFTRGFIPYLSPRNRLDAVLIAGLGRFGNGVQQLIHARAFGKAAGAGSILFFPNIHMHPRRIAIAEDMLLEPVQSPVSWKRASPIKIWRSDFFESGNNTHVFDSQASLEMREPLRVLYNHLISDDPGDRTVLTIHLRSGDIFSENPHSAYGQPPLSFYKQVIQSGNWSKIVLVSEDELNPCHKGIQDLALRAGIKVKLTGQTLREATRAISESTHLIASRGTFVPAIVYLSKNSKHIYQFHHEMDVIPSPIANNYRTVFDAKGEFVANALEQNWQNTRSQRILMMEYPIEFLSPVTPTHE